MDHLVLVNVQYHLVYGLVMNIIPKTFSEDTRADSGEGGSNGRTGGGPGLAHTLPTTSDKYRGLAYSAAVHSQWGRAGVPGMSQRPLPAVWPGAP